MNKGTFKKGNTPWNKNKKGIHLSEKSEFKKGQRPNNWTCVGTITTRTSKKNKKRNFIKIEEPNKWIELAKYNWKSKYGKILKGDIIHHMDGNSANDDIKNLIALPRTDHPIFHGRWGIKQLNAEQYNFYLSRYE
jgi:ABC-type Fe3+ transport system substrate-binding protein